MFPLWEARSLWETERERFRLLYKPDKTGILLSCNSGICYAITLRGELTA